MPFRPAAFRIARLIAIATFAFFIANASGADPHDWPTYNRDVLGSRFNSAEKTLSPKNVGSLVERWKFPPEGYKETVGVIHATPSVVNGHVYFGTATYPTFFKLAPDGTVKWKYKVRAHSARKRSNAATRLVPTDGVLGSALVTDEAVYFGDGGGGIYALDRMTGVELWKINSRDQGEFPGAHAANLFLASPVLIEGMVVFAGGAYEHVQPMIPFYKCCNGRGCVVALEPKTGKIVWKYDVGPEPEKFDPPLVIELYGKKHKYHYGPSTSSVWCTPSYDAESQTLFFGTDVHNAPKKPTEEDPRTYTKHSAAIIALNAKDGSEKWIEQINKNDVWNHTLPTYDPKTGYKDQSIGDTPKIVTLDVDGKSTKVVAFGCKNGGFYVLDSSNGKKLFQTPIYTDPPSFTAERTGNMLALPSAIGGIQTGCATDGKQFFTNGIDAMMHYPTGGQVSAVSLDLQDLKWQHQRPKVALLTRPSGKKPYEDLGDPVASGIAVANDVLFFTGLVSKRLVALDATNGNVLKEIEIGPVFAGPSVSRGRVYIGSGNTLFSPAPSEEFFPKQYTGTLYCFGLPDEDEVDRMGAGDE